ncbi:MAG TPA: ankyrin repeat domain-containing protein [Noviherbaspirillum sp.]|uniref:ankyrin repeat domain-containing protein n=1 Tax=Noviherbaspirillum sp. TaxID=1926288 RepID=UPI002B4847B7|nr:ankyrin repeat domain-containing protein [Noviherbaspirillum sp.]HJV86267.1 ankyrin repeat domain-containing protein [Noviherbaspirillum sp.]
MSDQTKRVRFLVRLVPALILISLVAWCTTNNRARQSATPTLVEIRELFLSTGQIDNSSNSVDLAAVAKRIGEPGMNDVLYEAASSASLDTLKWLVAHGADPKNIGALHELTLLQKAAKVPRVERLEYFLSFGLDPQQRTGEGMTLLHIAAQAGMDQRCLQLLTSKGLNLSDVDSFGRQPIHVASVKSIPVLVAAGADINAKDSKGRTALHHAAKDGKNDIVTELLHYSASVYAQDDHGRTPLHLAAMKLNYDSEKVVDTLLAAGAPTTARDQDGMMPRDLAIEARENSRYGSRGSIIDKL